MQRQLDNSANVLNTSGRALITVRCGPEDVFLKSFVHV